MKMARKCVAMQAIVQLTVNQRKRKREIAGEQCLCVFVQVTETFNRSLQ